MKAHKVCILWSLLILSSIPYENICMATFPDFNFKILINTVLPLMSTLHPPPSSPCLLFNFEALRGGVIRGWRLKEGGACFKKRRLIHKKFENFVTFSVQITVNNNQYDIYSLIYSSATSNLNCFNVYIFAPCAVYFSYCQIMDRIAIKAAFVSEALIRGRHGAYSRFDAYKRKSGKAKDAQYSL